MLRPNTLSTLAFTALALAFGAAGCFDLGALTSGGVKDAPDAVTADGGHSGDAGKKPNDAGDDSSDEAGDDDDDGPSTPAYCSTITPAPTFCDDFDGDAVGTPWEGGPNQTNGVAVIDSLESLSAPSSFSTKTDLHSPNDPCRASLVRSFPQFDGSVARVRLTFALYVDTFDHTATAETLVFQLVYGKDSDFTQLVINLDSAGSSLTAKLAENADGPTDDRKGYQAHPFKSAPKLHDWNVFRIELDVLNPTGKGNAIKVFLNDEVQVDDLLTLALKGGVPKMEVGISYVRAPAAAWALRYDNVSVDMK